MADKQCRVKSEVNLILRSEGSKQASLAAAISPGAIVHVTGPVNAAGYVPASVHGWLGTDRKTLYCDSLARASSAIDGFVYLGAAFRAAGVPDVYGREPGEVRGWLKLEFLEAIE